MRIFIPILLLILSVSCTRNKADDKKLNPNFPDTESSINEPILFTLLNPLQSGIKFVNNLTETTYMNGFFYEYYYNGAGISISDINNDGLQDILFISNLRKNKLYLNQGNLRFEDITEFSGMLESTGYKTGVTNVDINNDGWMDYYICKSGKYDDPLKRKNELWVNQGLNKKGFPTFVEQAAKYNLDIDLCSTQAAFFDYDRDGDLDMFLINHYPSPPSFNNIDELSEKKGIVTGDRMFENQNGIYLDVTQRAGLTNITRLSYGLGLSIGDFNNDKWPDVYVSNDYEGKDFLYLNNKNKTFRDVANEATSHVSYASMGTDVGDINNDGWIDFISLDMMAEDHYTRMTSINGMYSEKFKKLVDKGLHHQYMYNALQINNGSVGSGIPVFSDVAQLAGVSSTDWSWGPLIFDMDNDGFEDLFVSNGIKRDFLDIDFSMNNKYRKAKQNPKVREVLIKNILEAMPKRKKINYFFKNNGDLSFENKSSQWVRDIPTSCNGAAYGDLDNDGDLDIVVNNSDDVSFIYKSNTIELGLGNFLKMRFEGPQKNTMGIGARVIVQSGHEIQVREHYLTRGFQSSIGTGLHFGLGEREKVELVQVIWPDGSQQKFENVSVNQELILKYSEANKSERFDSIENNLLFTEIDNNMVGLNWTHRENNFDDFKRESLLPHKMSKFGPAIAVGDFDGDKLQDIYLGGAKGQKAVLYKQKKESTFESVQQELCINQKLHEDVDALFLDVDNDGDLDLYVVSGGNEMPINSNYYQDRLYQNENGIFVYRKEALPVFLSSGSCVRSIDYDGDGDEDLFIGGRQDPGRYPSPVKSYLLRNDSKRGKLKYTDVTDEIFPELNKIGMITDALIIDLNNDKKQDLILVGEWMQLRLFNNIGDKFKEMQVPGFKNTTGWWNTIKAADFDGDGDQDLIAGNLGLNYKYKATVQKPFKVYGSDFDLTGTFDIVLAYYQGESLFPLRGRLASAYQMPFIKMKFPTFDSFGKATLEEIYGKENLDKAINYSAQTFATTYFDNQGDGNFISYPLQNAAQITSVNDIAIEDFDKDGKLDLILVGNLYESEVETPRNDAGIGLFMRGDGKGNFSPVTMHRSGLFVSGETRGVKKMNLANGKTIMIFARNNDVPKLINFE